MRIAILVLSFLAACDPVRETSTVVGSNLQAGMVCTSDAQCLSGQCIGPHDCFTGCPNAKSFCGQATVGGACIAATDCNSGVCRSADGGAAMGVCCSAARGECRVDGDCCDGLTCATDNTGCRVGPTPRCLIDGVSYASNAPNPTNPDCQYCDPYTSPDSWTNAGSWQRCGLDGGTGSGGFTPGGPNFYCCQGVCSNQACN